MRRTVATLGAVAAVLLAVQAPAAAAVPGTGHFSVADGPFQLCGLTNVTYAEETDYRLVSRHRGPDGDWTFTVFTDGWFSFTNGDTGRVVTVTYHKADRDLRILASDGASRTLVAMNNRTEVWVNDLGQRIGSVHGPISFTVTVSYAGTPSEPMDDFWLSDPSDIRIRGDWKFDELFCGAMTASLT
ncbi:MAG: hypothetical protein ABIM89_00655 [Mycobacteriales bacterium]